MWDFCRGTVSPFLRFTPGFAATATCARQVTAVYGFGGALPGRLALLGEQLTAAGWAMSRPNGCDPSRPNGCDPSRPKIDRTMNLALRPGARPSPFPGGQGTPPWNRPPLSPIMRMTWSSQGQATGWRRDPNREHPTTRNYLALEVSEAGVPELLAETLARNEHALTLTIRLAYYSNPNARARPHRIPRHLLPTRPGAW